MKPTVKTEIKDRGWKRFLATIDEIKHGDPHVKVGILAEGGGGEGRGEGLTNVTLAAIHEFGTSDGKIPERSFIRSAVARHRLEYIALIQKLLKQVIRQKMTLRQMFDIVGLQAANDIKKGVVSGDGIPPPLKPETIRRKKSSRPLVDTGRMIGAVTWATMVRGSK